MGMATDEDLSDSLLYTPTWAMAAVCAVFILCSLAVERAIYFIGHVFRMHDQAALSAALEKIKEELMVVGFISLALTVGQRSVSGICVPRPWLGFLPQCRRPIEHVGKESETMFEQTSFHNAAVPRIQTCPEGEAPFILLEGLHQLHILLFVLAIVHVIYSIMIVALGMWKVYQWRSWEERATIAESLHGNGQIRLTKDVTFIRRHVAGRWSKHWFSTYFAAFFQQFFCSVSETDYLTLRHGFIKEHMLKNFNFHKYILKALEDDFKHVVGISPSLWTYMVFLILLNVQGWGMYWASCVPLIMVLVIGTKLRHIITEMAVKYVEKHAVVEGMPHVKPADELFWFRSPKLILYLIHFILFQDAIELSWHFWGTFVFPKGNCFYRHPIILLGRLLLGYNYVLVIIAQLICGCVMLPIYALVSQMGSQMKGNGGGREDWQKRSLKLPEEEIQGAGGSCKGALSKGALQVASLPQTGNPNPDEPTHLQTPKFDGSLDLKKQDHGDLEGIHEAHNGDEQTGTTAEYLEHLQTKMSFIQRVSRGVQSYDYYSLEIKSPSEKGTAS